MRTLSVLMIFLLSALPLSAELPLGKIPPKILLEGDLGGRLDGTAWNSEELISGKVMVLFYVDPDEADLNNHVRTIEKLLVADNRILNSFPETDVRLSDRSEAVWNVPIGFTCCPVRSMQHQIAYQF